MATVLRDQGLSKLIDGELETIASGFSFTEGPLWLPDGSVLFQDIKGERTHRVDAKGRLSTLREKTAAANGQTFGPDGWIVFCEQNGRRFSRMKPDGTQVETLAETFEGKRLNSPNDVVCRRDGTIVFTDPPYGVSKPEDKELAFNGVFALRLDGAMELLVDDMEKPNGLAFSPDESILYINDTSHYHAKAFAVDLTTGSLVPGSGRIFAKMDPNAPGGPDGMKVDEDGRVYIAVALGVWVYEADGTLLGILGTPSRPSNLAWGGEDGSTLYVTAVDEVHRIRFKTKGVMPPWTPKA
ncbi:MAG: SMP-30/gluconolactonase/LRE family protein [Isosphaeraceae bacterium]